MRKTFLGAVAIVSLISSCRTKFVPCDDNSCARGERCYAPEGVCIIDRLPVLTLTPVMGVQTQPTLEVTGTATDDVSVVKAEYSLDDGGTWAPGTIAGDMVRASVALPEVDSAPLAVLVRITDTGEQRVTQSLGFDVDRVGPQSTLVEPNRRVGGLSTRVVAQAVDGSGQVASMRLAFEGQNLPLTALDAGLFGAEFMLPQGREERLAITLAATDKYGNESTAAVGIDVATRGPAFDLVPDAGVVSPTPKPLAFRSVLPAQSVTATWRGRAVGVDAGTGDVYTVVLSVDAGVTDTSGALIVSGVDSSGNRGSSTLTVPVDAVGPTVRFVSPANGVTWGGDGIDSGVITLDVSDMVGVREVAVDFGDDAGLRMVSAPAWRLQVPLPRENGINHVLRARAVDSLGNVSVTTGPTVTVDTVAPTMNFISPTGVIGGVATMVDAIVEASDNRAGSAVTVEMFDFEGVVGPTTSGGGRFSRRVNVPVVDYQSRNLKARARDAAGNSFEVVYPVFVDLVAPTVTYMAPTAGAVVNLASANAGASFSVQLRTTDASPSVQYYLSVTGGAGDGVDRPVASSSNVNTSATDNGSTYTLSARAVDLAGNMGPAVTRTVVVDRVRPTASFNVTNGQRLAPSEFVATFSEPLVRAGSTAPLAISPSTASTLSGSTARASLLGYSIYSVAVEPSLTDVAGNPVLAPSAVRFSTEVKIPDANQPLATGIIAFDVVSDQDGVPVFALRENTGPSGSLRIVAYNPQFSDGLARGIELVSDLNFNFTQRDVELQAYRVVNADLTTATRHGGSWQEAGSTSRTIFAFENYVPMQGSPAFPGHVGVLMTPPIVNDIGLRNFASIRVDPTGPTIISRGLNQASEGTLALRPPPYFITSHNNEWRSIGFYDSYLFVGRSSLNCYLGTSCPYNPGERPLKPSASVPIPNGENRWVVNGAINSANSCFVFTHYLNPTTIEIVRLYETISIRETFLSTALLGDAPQTGAFGDTVLVARRDGSDVVLHDTSTSCQQRTELLRLPNSAVLLAFDSPRRYRPVRIGNRAALVYIDNNRDLRIIYATTVTMP